MNEWMNVWRNEWMNEWVNEWMNGRTKVSVGTSQQQNNNKQTNIQINKQTKRLPYYSVNEGAGGDGDGWMEILSDAAVVQWRQLGRITIRTVRVQSSFCFSVHCSTKHESWRPSSDRGLYLLLWYTLLSFSCRATYNASDAKTWWETDCLVCHCRSSLTYSYSLVTCALRHFWTFAHFYDEKTPKTEMTANVQGNKSKHTSGWLTMNAF